MGSERGQASIEWIGLVLLVTLGLGAVALAVRRAPAASGLGETLTERIVGAASASATAAPAVGVPIVIPTRAPKPPPAAGGIEVAAMPFLGLLAPRSPARGVRLPPLHLRSAQIVEALGRLGGSLEHGLDRAWLGCLAYRRFRWALNQGHTSIRPVPLDVGLDALNRCLNPFEFLGEME